MPLTAAAPPESPERAAEEPADTRRLPRLALDLIRGVADIARTTGALFAFEARQAARLVGARLITFVIALALLISGVMLAVAGLAIWLGSVLGATWMGFAVVGGGAILVGAAVVVWVARSLGQARDLRFPETRGQIGRDLEWLDQQFGADAPTNSND